MRRLFYLCFPLLLIGCATPKVYTTADSVGAEISAEYDSFQGLTWVKAPGLHAGHWKIPGNEMCLRAAIKKGASTFYQLYVSEVRPSEMYNGTAWAFYRRAFEQGGRPLELTEISQDVVSATSLITGPGVREVVGINYTREDLDRGATDGLHLRIDGQHDRLEIHVPAFYVEAFLKAVDARL